MRDDETRRAERAEQIALFRYGLISDLVHPAAGDETRRLYERLRETIVLGRLSRGMRLPSSRALARRLGISRNTVLFAYEELEADGWLSGRVGSGTRIAGSAQTVRFADPDGLALDGLSLRNPIDVRNSTRV